MKRKLDPRGVPLPGFAWCGVDPDCRGRVMKGKGGEPPKHLGCARHRPATHRTKVKPAARRAAERDKLRRARASAGLAWEGV